MYNIFGTSYLTFRTFPSIAFLPPPPPERDFDRSCIFAVGGFACRLSKRYVPVFRLFLFFSFFHPHAIVRARWRSPHTTRTKPRTTSREDNATVRAILLRRGRVCPGGGAQRDFRNRVSDPNSSRDTDNSRRPPYGCRLFGKKHYSYGKIVNTPSVHGRGTRTLGAEPNNNRVYGFVLPPNDSRRVESVFSFPRRWPGDTETQSSSGRFIVSRPPFVRGNGRNKWPSNGKNVRKIAAVQNGPSPRNVESESADLEIREKRVDS